MVSGTEEQTLSSVVQAWKELTDEEREVFIRKAEADRERFEREYEDWRLKQVSEKGVLEMDIDAVIDKRRTDLERKLARCDRESRLPNRRERPEGYPQAPRSAYVMFCQAANREGQEDAQNQKLAPAEPAEGVQDQGAAPGEEGKGAAPGAKRKHHLTAKASEWKTASLEERAKYEAMAAQDKERFQRELQAWLAEHPEQARSVPKKHRLPPGFPEPQRTAYAIFCKEHAARIREQQAAQPDLAAGAQQQTAQPDAAAAAQQQTAQPDFAAGAPETTDAGPAERGPKRKASIFGDVAKAWKALSAEERDKYHLLAAEDRDRVLRELEAWRANLPDGGFPEDIADLLRTANRGKVQPESRSPAPRVPRTRSDIHLIPRTEMGAVLQGAFQLGLHDRKKQATAHAAKEAQQRMPAGALGSGGDLAAESASGGGSTRGKALPQPEMMKPDTTVDDLLGGLMAVSAPKAHDDDDFDEDEGPDYNYPGGALLPHHGGGMRSSKGGWEMPEASGAPQVLGPQLCLDESGNIVLNQSSLSRRVDEARPADIHTGAVQECSVSQYEQAYKRTPPSKWTDQETEDFYQALRLYGTDLFLVQTFFRNKSAAQVKSKYTRELKRNPIRVTEALTTQRMKLTKDVFEHMHGRIDTSKHFKPPPSPLPGEEREPDGSLPGGARPGGLPDPEPEPPPPEPEYSAEDESLTTNRLMALFD